MYKKYNVHILKVAEEAEFVKVLNTEYFYYSVQNLCTVFYLLHEL